ncbi:MAG: STAS domain-containing protein, partial [Candidatus Peregrinibacteria bacterium]|nr:STAS domain-containing protein [Candidatus Peregrinibacteria bacterium]
QQKQDAFLSAMFRTPLRSELATDSEEEIVLPARPFHIVKVGLAKIYDYDSHHEFQKILKEIPDHLDVMLDMCDVSHIDSMTVGLLLTLHKRMHSTAHRCWIITAQQQPVDKVNTMRMNTVFFLRSTVKEAYDELLQLAL